MTLETGVDYLDDLDITAPSNNEDPSEGDDHLRNIKKAVTQSFPNISGAATPTQGEFNVLSSVTAGTVAASKAVVVDASKDIGDFNIVTAASFVGDLTGDVTGNVTATSVLADGVTATTQSTGDDDTSVATTAFVQQEIAADNANYVCIEERQTAGTGGGTFTSGAWRTRTLNTEVSDVNNLATLSSNRVTLTAGTYHIQAYAVAAGVDGHQIRLLNYTDTLALLTGSSEYATAGSTVTTGSVMSGIITVAASKELELQHRCITTAATTGFGRPVILDIEIYARLECFKL